MEKVTITRVNAVDIQVECDDGIAMELSEYFTFKVPGYQFMPTYRNKLWDGNVRLFNRRSNTIYAGLTRYIENFCEQRKYKFINKDDSTKYVASYIDKLIKKIPLTSGTKDITPRDYQLEAVKHAVTHTNSLLLSPTASGKSLIIYILIRWFLLMSQKNILLIVPTTSLVEQMYTDFEDYSQKDSSFNVADMCHRIYSGKDKSGYDQRITITTWQSIYKLPKAWFKNFGMVIGDEAHTFKAKSLTSIMEKLVNAYVRIGTTGTIDDTQTHRLVLEGVFGPVHKVTTTKKLMDNNDLAQLSIDVILLKHSEENRKKCKKLSYQEELDLIVSHEKRNNFIKNLALTQQGNTLILFNYVDKHGVPLYNAIKEKAADNRKIFYVSGKVPTKEREIIRAITEKETNAIIVASSQCFSTGINIKNLHNIIFAAPSKSQIRILQSIGRGLRKADNNKDTKVYDIADDMVWKSKKNYTIKHAMERIKIYTKELFKFKIHELQF